MIVFDKVELLTDTHPHRCMVVVFKNYYKNGRWYPNPDFDETIEFAAGCHDFKLETIHKQTWTYLLNAPYKYRDIPSIAKALPKLDSTPKHRPKPIDYDDLVAEECRE